MYANITSIVAEHLSFAALLHLERKARSTEAMLRARLSQQLRAAEVDMVFVHYLYGVVSAAMGQASPEARLGMLQHLAGVALPNDALTIALHAEPPTGSSSCARMVLIAEQVGRRDGEGGLEMDDPAAAELSEPGTFQEDGSTSSYQAQDDLDERTGVHRLGAGRRD